ncbi:MAG TPA: HPP family protein [Myxococcales bacterium]|nr:HPP family protein [Myxococcales bacterium]
MPEEQARLTLFEPLVIRGITRRLRLQWLLTRFDERKVWAAFMFVNGFITIALLAMVALATGTPFVFPSLGPTAFLFFFDPRAPSASPHHAIVGHAIGILCGYGSLLIFHLEHSGSALALGVTWSRVLAAALSLAATGAVMILLNAAHPPAGATTLIISLGAISRPAHLVIIELALVLLVVQAIAINRLAGLDYPLWRRRARP